MYIFLLLLARGTSEILYRASGVKLTLCGHGKGGSRSAIDKERVAESNVAQAHEVSAWVATELTEPACIKSEALAGRYIYLGDKTAALVLGVVRDQILGLVAQDLVALGLESLVGIEFV